VASAEITFRYALPGQISKNATAWWKVRSRFAPQKGTEGSNACLPAIQSARELFSDSMRIAALRSYSRFPKSE
jgi:hypothetical protein